MLPPNLTYLWFHENLVLAFLLVFYSSYQTFAKQRIPDPPCIVPRAKQDKVLYALNSLDLEISRSWKLE